MVCTRPMQTPTTNISAVVVLAIEPSDGAAERRHHEHDRGQQQVHRGLREHQPLEGLALGADLDVGGIARHLDDVLVEVVAARLVQPDFLEAVQQIHQPVEQPVVPGGGLALAGGELMALGVKDHRGDAQNGDAQHERQHRQIGDIDPDEDDQHDALAGERDHVGRLRERGGVLVDGGDDLGAADRVERDELGMAHQIHQAYAQMMDDGLDLDRRRDEDVVLGLDEEIERHDEQKRGPDADRALAGVLRAGVDRGQDGGVADAAEARHDDQPLQRALHFAADKLKERH